MTRRRDAERDAAWVVSRQSRLMFAFFSRLFARDLAANFHGVRLLGSPPPTTAAPIILVVNHPSWWDAALFVFLSSTLFSDRRCFAPIEARMLLRYRFFERIGLFGVESGSIKGASRFLAISERILQGPGGLLFVNAEGRFSDVRARPFRAAPGIAHLLRRVPHALLVPLAIEYTFWDERRPNLLLRFGTPIPADTLHGTAIGVSHQIGAALVATMDELAGAAITRDPRRFRTLLSGRAGINVIYDLSRRARAFARGQRFDPAHGDPV